MVRGNRVDLGRGQLGYSQVTLAKRWRWSRGKVRRYLTALETAGDIVQQKNSVTSVITIIKYDQWQPPKTTNDTTNLPADGQQTDSRRTADGTLTIRIKKNKKNKKNIYKNTNTSGVPPQVNPVNEIIYQFRFVNPSYQILFARKNQRDACERMINKFGFDKICRLIEGVVASAGKPFYPTITTPVQLEEKMGQFLVQHKKEENNLIFDDSKVK